jgi:hypothetical protein
MYYFEIVLKIIFKSSFLINRLMKFRLFNECIRFERLGFEIKYLGSLK